MLIKVPISLDDYISKGCLPGAWERYFWVLNLAYVSKKPPYSLVKLRGKLKPTLVTIRHENSNFKFYDETRQENIDDIEEFTNIEFSYQRWKVFLALGWTLNVVKNREGAEKEASHLLAVCCLVPLPCLCHFA